MSRAARARYHARWVAPIASRPIEHGWVEVEGGFIRAVGAGEGAPADAGIRDIHLGSVCILPGLVNAHTHLELSAQRGAVPSASSMPAWAAALMRRLEAEPTTARSAAISSAVDELYRAGTALVGDVANTRDSMAVLEAGPVEAVIFREVLGFDVAEDEAAAVAERLADRRRKARTLRCASVPPPTRRTPFPLRCSARLRLGCPGRARCTWRNLERNASFSVPGPGPGGGSSWRVAAGRRRGGPRAPGTVAYLDSLGWLREDTLVVHGVHLTPAEIHRVAESGATIVTCPAQQRLDGRRGPARGLVLSGRGGGGCRHRQSGQRSGPEYLHGAGSPAPACAGGPGTAHSSRAPRSTVRLRWGAPGPTGPSRRAAERR